MEESEKFLQVRVLLFGMFYETANAMVMIQYLILVFMGIESASVIRGMKGLLVFVK